MSDPKRIMTGQNISPRLLKALGLPDNAVKFTLTVEGGKVALLHVECHPRADQEALADIITTEYELVERRPA